MQQIKFKTTSETLTYSYDVCELVGCENRSAKIVKINFNYYNLCVLCYEKQENGE